MPPETDDVKVILCPESYVADDGDIVGVPNAELTDTKSTPEVADVGVVALSVTL